MRNLLTVFLAVVVTAGGGLALCAAAGWPAHPTSMLAAGAVALVASLLAVLPPLLARGADPAARAQAALIGTLVHLFGCLGGAAVMLMVVKGLPGAAYWMFAFYSTTLVAVVGGLAREMRAAPVAGAPAKH